MNFKNAINRAVAAGWAVSKTGRSHYKLVPPDPTQAVVYCSSTPSDKRALDNFLSQLRRSGLDIKPPRKPVSPAPCLANEPVVISLRFTFFVPRYHQGKPRRTGTRVHHVIANALKPDEYLLFTKDEIALLWCDVVKERLIVEHGVPKEDHHQVTFASIAFLEHPERETPFANHRGWL